MALPPAGSWMGSPAAKKTEHRRAVGGVHLMMQRSTGRLPCCSRRMPRRPRRQAAGQDTMSCCASPSVRGVLAPTPLTSLLPSVVTSSSRIFPLHSCAFGGFRHLRTALSPSQSGSNLAATLSSPHAHLGSRCAEAYASYRPHPCQLRTQRPSRLRRLPSFARGEATRNGACCNPSVAAHDELSCHAHVRCLCIGWTIMSLGNGSVKCMETWRHATKSEALRPDTLRPNSS